jgi:predicted ATPase/class 3 adenylate cyclase
MIAQMRRDLPSGTVTFLFTDIEGSTRLLHELGAVAYAEVLAGHRRIIRGACAAEGGVEVDTQGDAFFFAFPTAPGALAAASALTGGLASGRIRVRVGLHTGTPLLADEGYVGGDVHRAARIAASGHGGQVLVSSSTAALVEIELTDLGEHRLKDLSAPERIYQLADGEFPPLKTLYRTNLPVPATPFLGRETELAEVVQLLTGDDPRVLTLTGPGGTGKTRLALQAAAAASESFPDGIFWVPLAPLRDPELVLPELARTLSVSEEPGTPLEQTLVVHLSGKSLLLLLDNVEHLLPPAAEHIATLRSLNGSRILVTSRERLRIGGEQTWPVPPLDEGDGTALFVARAHAIDPSFAQTPIVDELCRRLDELPLAIELAAARTAVFSADQLLVRLSQRLDLLKGERDADPRQQTLRATIEWSHDLLDEDEKRLFARLAVFVGGCTYEAAEDVAGADPDMLQSLLDKSLIRKRDTALEPRYWMLETIHEYAVERLEESRDANQIRRRNCEHFLALAEDAFPNLQGSPGDWLDRLEAEHDNFRAALDWLATAGETQCVLELAGALWKFWDIRGHSSEGGRRLERGLFQDSRPTPARARALNGATAMAVMARDTVTARARADEAQALHRKLGDDRGLAGSIQLLGIVEADDRQYERALELFEDSLGRFEELGDPHYTLLAMRLAAWMHYELGDVAGARALHEEVVQRARTTANSRMQATSLGALGEYALREERIEDALPLLEQGFRISLELGERGELLVALWRFAWMLALAGRPTNAARVFSAAEALRDEMGIPTYTWMKDENEETLARIHSQLENAAFAEAWERGRTLTLEEALALALEEPTSA